MSTNRRLVPIMSSTGIAILVMASLVAAPAIGSAQSMTDLAAATLDDLLKITITTASRSAEGLGDAPAQVEVITARQIEARGYRSLADVLADQLGFKLDLAGDQDYPAELTVQGIRGTSRIVLLLDGIRVASPTGEPLPILANYPVHSARQIEIVYGPASALYGADAFSAVINVISKSASEAPGLSLGTTVGQFGLINQTASYGTRLGNLGSVVVNAQVMHDAQPDLSRYYPADFGGMQAQRSGIFNTIFGAMTLDQPVSPEYDVPASAHSLHAAMTIGALHVSLFENRSRISTSPAYTPDNAVYTGAAFNQNDLLVTAASYARSIGAADSTTTVTFSRHELSPQSGYWNVFSNMKRSYKYAFGSMAKVEQQLSWKPWARGTLTTGATFERFHAIPQGADLNAPIESQSQPGTILDTNITDDFVNLRYSNTGGYVQIQQTLPAHLLLTAGGRADYNTRYGATFNPRVGLVANPFRGTTLKLLYGTAYLAPSPFQAFSHYGSFYSTDGGQTFQSDYWHLPNPDLKPQHISTVQVTAVQGLGPLASLSGSVFSSRARNLIKSTDPDQAYAGTFHGWPVAYIDFPVNEGVAKTHGGTLSVDFLKSWTTAQRIAARMGVSYADGTVWGGDGGDEITLQTGAYAPLQLLASTDINWQGWTGAFRVVAYGRQRLIATSDLDGRRRTLDGYQKADLNLRRNGVWKNIDLFLTIENLFDARYRNINIRAYTNPEEMIGAPQNPRRIFVGFNFKTGR
jgi:outer membrane receptor for ferrienterochelin and colicin